MSSSKVYGVAVIGLGIAGRVRVRDLLQYTSHHGDVQWCLKGFVSRRTLEIEGAKQLTEDEVFTREDVDAILICTENGSHERLVRKGLENGKHVLCEFPLALSLKVAKEFFEIAERKSVILHEENIGLINDYKEQLDQSTPWKHCDITLKGSYNGWIEDHKTSGPPFVCNVSLIETACHLCGDVKAVGGTYSENKDSFHATAHLETPDKRTVTISLRRFKESDGREKSIIFQLQDGTVLNLRPSKTPGAKPGLFMRDFYNFMEEVTSGKIDQEMKDRTLRAFQLAEDIRRIIMPKSNF